MVRKQKSSVLEPVRRHDRSLWMAVAIAVLLAGCGPGGTPTGPPEGGGAVFPAPQVPGVTRPSLFTTPADPRAQRLQGLQALLDSEIGWIYGETHVHVRLEDGSQAGVDADQPVPAASIIKLPVMGAYYAGLESG